MSASRRPGPGAALALAAAVALVPGGAAGEQPPGSSASAPTAPAPAPLAYGPLDTQAMYGPPAPKARHGRLAPIGWGPGPGSVPPALRDAVALVTRTYPTADSARAAVRAAASDVSAARWTRFPNFSVSSPWLSDRHSPQPQIVVEAPILDFGRVSATVRRAKAAEAASSAGYVDTVRSLALATVQAYFDVVRLTEREQLLAASLAEHRRLADTIDRRVRQEVSPRADLELARSRVAQVEQDYSSAHAQRLQALRAMAQLVGDPGYDLGPIPYFDPALDLPDPDTLEDQATAYSPQLAQLAAQVDEARADYAARKAAIFPSVNAQYSYDDFYGHRVGAVLRAQGDGGLANVSQANAARVRIDQAIEDQQAAEAALRRDVASDVIEFQGDRARIGVARTAAETAAAVSESYMRQYIAGRRSWLDVMNALRETVSARIGETENQVATMAANARLLIKSGRWRPTFDQNDESQRQRL